MKKREFQAISEACERLEFWKNFMYYGYIHDKSMRKDIILKIADELSIAVDTLKSVTI